LGVDRNSSPKKSEPNKKAPCYRPDNKRFSQPEIKVYNFLYTLLHTFRYKGVIFWHINMTEKYTEHGSLLNVSA